MAKVAIEARDRHSPMYQQLIHTIGAYMGYSIIVVDRKIEELCDE